MDRADAVDLALADDVDSGPTDPTVDVLEQVDDERVLDDFDARVVLDAVQSLDQRPADLLAGGVTAGVQDPVCLLYTSRCV